MSAFGGLILTNRGRNLQAKTQAGAELKYTRIALGDGNLGSTPIADLILLKNEVKSLSIQKLKVLTQGRALIGSVLSNQDLSTGFYFREIGVFALDPDLGEVLYCYGNAGSLAEYIPAGGGPDVIEKNIDIQTLVGSTQNISAVIDSSLVYVTQSELTDALENISVPVTSVNAKTGDITLTADDVGAETPLGAEIKSAQAEANSVEYTDQKFIDLAGEGNTKTVKQLDDEAKTHWAEMTIHQASGTANTITISTGGDFQYQQGKWLQFKANYNNTGNVTINVDGKGTKPFLKVDGSQIASGGVKTPKVYKAYYDEGSGGRFFLLASAEGDAVAGNVLAGKIFSNDDDTGIIGTMPNRGTVNQTITTQGGQYTIPDGYHNGVGRVTASFANLQSGNIRAEVNVGGVVGTLQPASAMIPYIAEWRTRTSGTTVTLQDIAYGNGMYVAVGDSGTILTSPDGATWTARTSGVSDGLLGVNFHDGMFTIGAQSGVLRSNNSINWTFHSLGLVMFFRRIVYGNGMYVAIGSNAQIFTSTNGTSWTMRATLSGALTDITFGNGTFVVSNSTGIIFTSTNAINWTTRTSGVSNQIWRVHYGNGLFVFVNATGEIRTSPDGVSWTWRSSGVSTGLYALNYDTINGMFVAGGASGVVLISSNGTTWRRDTVPNPSIFVQGATLGHGSCVVVASQGGIMSLS